MIRISLFIRLGGPKWTCGAVHGQKAERPGTASLLKYTPYSLTLDVQASGVFYFAERTLRRRVSVLRRFNFHDGFNETPTPQVETIIFGNPCLVLFIR